MPLSTWPRASTWAVCTCLVVLVDCAVALPLSTDSTSNAVASNASSHQQRQCPQATTRVVEFNKSESYAVSTGSWTGNLSTAHRAWPRIQHSARVHMAQSIVSREEASRLIELLEPQTFDVDKDTVDRMATHEFYLQKNGNIDDIATIPGKPTHDEKRRAVSVNA